jgi:hypothetical protein
MADPVAEQVSEFEEFVEIPVPPPPPSDKKEWPRSVRIAVSLALAALPLGLLWVSVGALWGQAFTSTPGTLMPALTGISVNSALLFIFITDFIAARTGYSA